MSLRIIISPAKKMNQDTDSLTWTALPAFLDKTQQLLNNLRALDGQQLKRLWQCNDQIAALNFQRIQDMDLTACLTPAILAYEGIQYQYMAPGVFSYAEFDYIQEHLRILSGFYGMLRPFDGVRPYRLEMQAKLAVNGHKDLYSFWGSDLAQALEQESETIIDLASKEYSRAIVDHLSPSVQLIGCIFAQWNGRKLVEKGTICKMARGEMVRFLAEKKAESPEDLKGFDRLGFHYAPEKSRENRFVFIKDESIEH